jgi:hypothetical protein
MDLRFGRIEDGVLEFKKLTADAAPPVAAREPEIA